MPILFIDANAYLQFYKAPKAADLLASLDKQRAHIFITRLIADEVIRNALNCTIEMVNSVTEVKLHGIKDDIPDFLIDDEAKTKSLLARIEALQKDGEKLRHSAESLNRDLKGMIVHAVEAVAFSKDLVSRSLKSIFDGAVTPSDAALARARLRREVGNPPGKKSDRLGDQLNWEQLLESLEAANGADQDIWIISKDKDYLVTYGNKCYLNPFLLAELEARCGSGKIRCFATLSAGIPDFAKETNLGEESIPPAEVLDEIQEQEERTAMPNETAPTNLGPPPLGTAEDTLKHARMVLEARLNSVKELIPKPHHHRTNYRNMFFGFNSFGRSCRRSFFPPDSELREIISRVDGIFGPSWNDAFNELTEINTVLSKSVSGNLDEGKKASLTQRKSEAGEAIERYLTTEIIPVLEKALTDVRRLDPHTHRFPQ